MRQEYCAQCGYTLAPGEAACPRCQAPVAGVLRPLGGAASPAPTSAARSQRPREEELEALYRREEVAPVEGQDPPGSFGYLWFIAKQDPLLAAVFVLQALNALAYLATGSIFGGAIAAAIFWGVYTFQLWGYWVAIVLAGVGVLLGVMAMGISPVAGIPFLALPLFTLIILARRRQYFA